MCCNLKIYLFNSHSHLQIRNCVRFHIRDTPQRCVPKLFEGWRNNVCVVTIASVSSITALCHETNSDIFKFYVWSRWIINLKAVIMSRTWESDDMIKPMGLVASYMAHIQLISVAGLHLHMLMTLFSIFTFAYWL